MADYSIGKYVKRNCKMMIYPTINTTGDVKNIARGNEYQILARFSAANGYVYSIQSLQTAIRYDVANVDLKDFFDLIENTTQKELEFKTEAPKPEKKCTCNSLDLFKFGCKCGAITNEYELRYKSYQQDLMGPRMGEDD